MGNFKCLSCKDPLYFSHPALEAKGLFSPEFVDFLKKLNGSADWICLKCLGLVDCVSCGARLGEFDRVVGYADNETDNYCGSEYCVDCVLEFLRSPSLMTAFFEVREVTKKALDLLSEKEFERALIVLERAQLALANPVLEGRRELDDLKAQIYTSKGICLRNTARSNQATGAFCAAEQLYQKPALRGQTNREADLLRLYSEMSAVADKVTDADAWFRQIGAKLCDMVDCLPPRDVSPFSEMRQDFHRFHENWLTFAISKRRFDLIPEIIAQVQGRDMVASLAEMQVEGSELDTPEGLERFILARRGLRSMLASDGQPSEQYLKHTDKRLPNTEGANFDRDFAGLRRALQNSRTAAAETDKLSILEAPHRTISSHALQSKLTDRERLLILFAHGGQGHALILGTAGEKTDYICLPELPAITERLTRFDSVGRNRRGMRRNDRFDGVSPEASFIDRGEVNFWSEFSSKLRKAFWLPIEKKLPESCKLIVCSSGNLHNLCLDPGRPAKVELMARLPGLAFFAKSRGLLGENLVEPQLPPNEDMPVSILADEAALDIPLAGIEGRAVARIWGETIRKVEYPSSFPASETPLGLDLSRNCSAPLTWYFATKERHHGTETNPRVPRRSSARSLDERAAA